LAIPASAIVAPEIVFALVFEVVPEAVAFVIASEAEIAAFEIVSVAVAFESVPVCVAGIALGYAVSLAVRFLSLHLIFVNTCY
jgi:hypothetical protein